MHIEIELKFALDAETAEKLLSSRLVQQAASGEPHTRRLVSTYHDTRQHLLRQAGTALRVRQAGDQFEQTIKLPSPGPVGMQNFEEWTVPLDNSQPDLSRIEPGVIEQVNPRHRTLKLLPLFTTEIERTTLLLRRDNTRFELALDQGRIVSHVNPKLTEAVRELEFELVEGDPLVMLDFALALNDELGLSPEHRTKAQRGYALTRLSLRPKPTDAKHVLLDPEMNAGQAFQKIITDALEHLFDNEIPVIQGMPGGVHQARVSIRRIRAALRAFKRILPYDKRKAFNGEFRWFQGRLGRARDWHVFLSETLPNIRDRHGNAHINLDRLHKIALRERRRATRDAMQLFQGKRYTRLLLQFQRWLIALERENPELFQTDLQEFSRRVLEKTRRDMLLDPRPLSRMSADELHELRKRGKKARYATEFFADLLDPGRLEPYVEMMKAIQKQLGDANDAVVARHVLAGVPPKSLKESTLTLVQSWSEQQVRDCVKRAQPTWRKYKAAPPFWRENGK